MTIAETEALRGLYNFACHHPRCERSETPHQCSCGLSAALEKARQILNLPDSEFLEKPAFHDDACEAERTDHGYTPCRCDERTAERKKLWA